MPNELHAPERLPMRYALIGCGRIAPYHWRAAQEAGLSPVGICDILPERMDALLAANAPIPTNIARHEDYRRLLDEQRPELVAIATQSGAHARIALDCIERGIHVIIEKPIALSMADAYAIVDAAKKHRVKVCACHQNRFNQAVQAMRGALEAGRFGALSHGSVHVRWNRGRAYYDQAPWRGTWKDDGGCLMNQCIHGIDLLRWMLGDAVEEVYGVTRRRFHDHLQTEDVGLALLTCPSGAVGAVEGTTNVYPKNLEETLCLFGQTGTARLGGTSINHIEVWDFASEFSQDRQLQGLRETTKDVYGNGHLPLYMDMIDAIRTDRVPYIDGMAGLRALEIVLAIYKSQHTGLPVRLPLMDFSTEEMVGVF